MPSTRIVIIGLCLTFGFLTAGSSAQEFNEDIADSEFSKAVDAMGGLIRLVEVDGTLKVARDWEKQHKRETAGLSEEERLEKLIEEQVERGLPRDFAERHAKRTLERNDNTPAIRTQFDKLQKAFGAGSSGGGGGGGNWRWRFDSGTFSGNLNTSGEKRIGFRFSDNELGVSMEFREAEDDKLNFRLSSETGIIDLDQRDGRIRLAIIENDKASVHIADNFHQLKKKHPSEVRRFLFNVWESFGIQRPLSPAEPAAVQAIVEKLKAIEGEGMDVYGLLEALAGDSLSARDDAEKSLKENFYKWNELVAKYEEEFEFDERSTKRLQRIRDGHPATQVQDYVNSLDLDDMDVLIQVWENAPTEDHQLIINRLESSTGLSLGNDVQAWKDRSDSSDTTTDQ